MPRLGFGAGLRLLTHHPVGEHPMLQFRWRSRLWSNNSTSSATIDLVR